MARVLGAAKTACRFFDLLFGWLVFLYVVSWALMWLVESFQAGRVLGLDDLMPLAGRWFGWR